MKLNKENREFLENHLRKYKGNNYFFRASKEGYLSYRTYRSPKARKFLLFLFKVVTWLLDKRNENDRVNKVILRDLGLSEDTQISNLDAFYKKEFRKKKYIFYSKPKASKDITPPQRGYSYFLPGESKNKTSTSFIEFLKMFNKDLSEEGRE